MTITPTVQSPPSAKREDSTVSLATLVLASSVSLGSNLLEVKNGRMEPETALANALVKGTLSSAVLAGMRPTTPLRVAGGICLLGSVGYVVDFFMKKNPESV